jgi:hypothetical protein
MRIASERRALLTSLGLLMRGVVIAGTHRRKQLGEYLKADSNSDSYMTGGSCGHAGPGPQELILRRCSLSMKELAMYLVELGLHSARSHQDVPRGGDG